MTRLAQPDGRNKVSPSNHKRRHDWATTGQWGVSTTVLVAPATQPDWCWWIVSCVLVDAGTVFSRAFGGSQCSRSRWTSWTLSFLSWAGLNRNVSSSAPPY